MDLRTGPRPGDVVPLTGSFKVYLGDVVAGFGAQRGHLTMVMVLGTCPKGALAEFDPVRRLGGLGWVLGKDDHPDNIAADNFVAAMKIKLARSREKGRGGWEDPERCSTKFLVDQFLEHLLKGNAGNFEDLANFCMMLHQRGDDPMLLAQAARKLGLKDRSEPGARLPSYLER